MMAALLMTACGHRTSNGNTTGSDSVAADTVPFATDSIYKEREDKNVSVKVTLCWPKEGVDALCKSIRRYLSEQLSTALVMEGKPDVKFFDDGTAAAEATVSRVYKELLSSWQESKADSLPVDDMQYSYAFKAMVLENTDSYVTVCCQNETFMGGAHGSFTAYGLTFRKSDGKRIGYHTAYNRATEKYDLKDQALFKDPQSKQLAALIKEGVRSYFKECGQTVDTDEQLKDELIGIDDVNSIPLPSTPPYFMKGKLAFAYQQYEIASYAAGIINFDIPFEKVKPFLTPEAAALIK